MITLINEEIRDLELEVLPGEKESLRLVSFSSFPQAKIHIKVQNGGVFDGVFADFSSGKGTFDLQVELLGSEANATWRYAGVSKNDDDKIVLANMNHLAPRTRAEVNQYGIAMESGRLSFFGVSAIGHGQHACTTSQVEKIIVFDAQSVGKCSPSLIIDDNDVTASHSATVGKLSDEHLFYLLSRGIDLDNAKRLLTLGYLRPVLEYFEGDVYEKIQTHIEEGF